MAAFCWAGEPASPSASTSAPHVHPHEQRHATKHLKTSILFFYGTEYRHISLKKNLLATGNVACGRSFKIFISGRLACEIYSETCNRSALSINVGKMSAPHTHTHTTTTTAREK